MNSELTKSKIFFILSLSFISGVFGASFYYPSLFAREYLCMFFVLSIVIFALTHKNKKLPGAVIAASVFFFALGLFWVADRLVEIRGSSRDGAQFSGKATVSKEPEMNGIRQKLIITPEDKKLGKFLISTGFHPEYSYGEDLQISCQLRIPSNDGLDFDYRMYLAKDGIFYECKNAKIEKMNTNSGNRIYSGLLDIKNMFEKKIYSSIPSPESGLLVGLILGGSNQLSDDVQNDFSRTGLTHIVAVSGYNVTIVAEYLMIVGIFLGLWRQQAFWFAVCGIILFVIITGLSASAVRAGVMGVLLIWAMKNGRLANSGNAVLFAAIVMLAANPLLLRWDVGFQLSFLATLGIIYLYPFFEDHFVKQEKHAKTKLSQGQGKSAGSMKRMIGSLPVSAVMEILFLSLSAQIFVLPVILYNFKQLSVISPLANVLVLPIIPLTMLLGFTASLASFLAAPIAKIFFILTYLPLRYITTVIERLSSLKYSAVPFGMSWLAVVVWYIILTAVIFKLKTKKYAQEETGL